MSLLPKQPQLPGDIWSTKIASFLEHNEWNQVSPPSVNDDINNNSKKENPPPRWPERFRIRDSKVEDVAMSPNEEWIATISSSPHRVLKLYHRSFGYSSGGIVPAVRNVRGICFAPSPSSSERVSWMMSYSKTEVVLWNLSVCPPICRVLGKEQNKQWRAYKIAAKPVFSLDGKYVATCKKDFRYGYVYNVWFTGDGTYVRQWSCTTLVYSISIQSNEVDGGGTGYHLAVFGGSSQIMTLWDLELDTTHRLVDSIPGTTTKRSSPPYIEVKITEYSAEEARRNLNVDSLGKKCGIQFEDQEGKTTITLLRTEDGILQRHVSSYSNNTTTTATVDPTHKIVRYFYSEGKGVTKRLVEQSYVVFGSLQEFVKKEKKKTGGKRIRLVLLDDKQEDQLDVMPKTPSWHNALGCIWRMFHLFSIATRWGESQQQECIVIVPRNFRNVPHHFQDDYFDQVHPTTTTIVAASCWRDASSLPALVEKNRTPVKQEPVGEDFVDGDGASPTTAWLPGGNAHPDNSITCDDKQPDVVKFAPQDDDGHDDDEPGNGNKNTTLKVQRLGKVAVYKTYPRSILKKGSNPQQQQCPPPFTTTTTTTSTKSLQKLVDAVRRQQHQEKHGIEEQEDGFLLSSSRRRYRCCCRCFLDQRL